ncbi:alpha/beta hydrolase-fold protein [Streptomyces carpinensis]|uniref:Alpha/beta hydrolase-fold protein n=1 Tax=Streptomyces carpinensis TaxID=66369 RepID=A0ABV1VXY4_9ACTN|nr:alpha/beta hydrolase-fold protein [Streptomyces carpinensis]
MPPEYFCQPHRVFPTAVVLTGYPGVAEALYKKLKYPAVEASLVRGGQAQPMILVMLRPTVAPPRDTECMKRAARAADRDLLRPFFAQDLRAALLGHYRIGAGVGSWGVIGDSTGGYCALKLALEDPADYSAGVGLSADYAAPKDPTTDDLFGGSEKVRLANNLSWRLQHLPQAPVSLDRGSPARSILPGFPVPQLPLLTPEVTARVSQSHRHLPAAGPTPRC